jgi:ferredoxin
MSSEDNEDEMWHTGLHARLDTSFPKKCMNCGRIFETAEQYFAETLDIREQDKGLKTFVDEDTSVVVEAFRNCPCGSTLMEMFDDHRESLQDEHASTASPANSTVVNDNRRSEKPMPHGTKGGSYEDLAEGIDSGLSELDLLHVEEKWGSDWYSGLRPRGQSAFPKKCRNCGRVYETPDDFFTETANISPEDTGLRAFTDEDDAVVIEAYRNCICGSTLMDNFSDRRDMSPAGRERRERFGQMLDYLIQIGLNADTAYAELLKVARGGESKILAKIKPPE